MRVDDQPPRVVHERVVLRRPLQLQHAHRDLNLLPVGQPLLFVSHMRLGQHVLQLVRFGGGTASATSNGGDGQTHTIDELVDVVHDYLISNTNTLEAVEPEIRNANSCGSSPMSSCPCTTCNATSLETGLWSNNSGTTAFDFSTITLTAHPDSSQAPPAVEGCLSSFLENSFMRVAAREANIGSRIGYEYAAFQAGGSPVQWPAQQWCQAPERMPFTTLASAPGTSRPPPVLRTS